MNNRQERIHIDIDDDTYINSSTSSSYHSSSFNSSSFNDNNEISPMSYTSYSPERRIPTANRITNISNIIADVIPFEFNSIIEDDFSLPSNSTFTHSENSYYNKVEYNRISFTINLINIFFFFMFAGIDKNSIENINPNDKSLFFYAIDIYPYCSDLRNNIWKLFSYSFVHANILHLLGNSIGIYVVTVNLYKFQSLFILFFIYFITTINGALSFYLTNPYDVLIGASGGVYGLAGSNLANFLYNYDNMYDYEITFSYAFYFLFITIDLFNYFVFYNEKIAYQNHWYGFLTGILLGLSIFRCKKNKVYKKYIRYISILLFSYVNSLLLFNFIFNFPSKYSFNYFKFVDEESCCYESKQINNNATYICKSVYENSLLY